MKKIQIIFVLTILLSLPAARSAAFYPELHALLAYEASLIEGVPSEISSYVGEPGNYLSNYNDTICRGSYDEDADRDPRLADGYLVWWGLLNWGTHFWQPSAGPAGGLLEQVGGVPVNVEHRNAYQRAGELYSYAKDLYPLDPTAAYYQLGKVVHLLGDMAVPAHVHLDPHITDSFAAGDESLEEYTAARYVFPGKETGLMLFESDFPASLLQIADHETLPDGGFSEEPALFRIFYSMATLSAYFDSDDADGSTDAGVRRGSGIHIGHPNITGVSAFGPSGEVPLQGGYQLSSKRSKFILLNSTIRELETGVPLYEGVRLEFPDGGESRYLSEFLLTDIGDDDSALIAGMVIPAALANISSLYKLFWTETHPSLQQDNLHIMINKGEHRSNVIKPAPLELIIDIESGGWNNIRAEVFVWVTSLVSGNRIRRYYDGHQWTPYEEVSEIRPLYPDVTLGDVHDLRWRVLDDTSFLPDAVYILTICIDRTADGFYSTSDSMCRGIPISVE